MSETPETDVLDVADGLTESEKAFFDTGGEKAPEIEGQQQDGEQAADEQQQAADRDEKGRFVPHGALHAEREEHKKTKAELQELREFRARMDERWRLAQEMQQRQPYQQPAQQQEVQPPPDPNEDIFGAYRWMQQQNAALAQQFQQLQAEIAQQQHLEIEAVQQEWQEQAIWNVWGSATEAYSRENPDFGNAAKWLSEQRDRQLQALAGVDTRFGSSQVRNQQINQELQQIIVSAAQAGRNPAEAVYAIAQSWGYQQAGQKPGGLPANLQRIEQAQQQSRTVGQAAGTSGGDEVTPEALATMSEAEFASWMSKPGNARKFERMMA